MFKQTLTLFFAIIPLIVMSQTNNPPHKSGTEVMRELRMKVLTTPASALAITPTKDYPRVFAVLMDWPLGTNTISVFSACTGDASLYTTSTFGVIGGIAHETVRAAAKQFVKTAEIHHDDAKLTNEYPYPKPGRVYFYLICFDGVRLIDAAEISLHDKESKYYALYSAGQQAITELRETSEKLPPEAHPPGIK